MCVCVVFVFKEQIYLGSEMHTDSPSIDLSLYCALGLLCFAYSYPTYLFEVCEGGHDASGMPTWMSH